jgi:hypothetical protein
LLAGGGCTSFDNPVVAETGPELDAALLGRWSCSEDRGSVLIDITRDGDAGHLSLVSAEKGEHPKTDETSLITARLERMTFASVGGGEAGKESWNLVRYELRGPDRLSIYLDNERFWKDAVRNKLVSGGQRKSESGVLSTAVTASSEEMRKVVLAYGSVIFEDNAACEFTRQ